MFRRKEENANEMSADEAGHEATHTAMSHENAAPASTPAMTAPVASAPAAPAAAAPSAPSVSYTPAARPAQAQPSYRPAQAATPAEFNRSAGMVARAAAAAEPARPAASSLTASATSDKAPSIKPNRRVLTVGNDILLKGEIATCDRLLIEGRVEAKLSDVHTVEIAECGSFKGTAEVEDAEVSGVFEGDLIVRNRLVIYASGEVRGNISYGEVEIERGGRLTGQIKTVTAAAAKPAALASEKSRNAAVAKEQVAA